MLQIESPHAGNTGKPLFGGITLALMLICATPVLGQPTTQPEPQVDLESIDSLLGGDELSGEQPTTETPPATEDAEPVAEPGSDPDAPVDEAPAETAPDETPPGDAPELSDLDRSYLAYAHCIDEAARALTGQGEAAEVVGVRTLLRCPNERAAYVNAFYFTLLPNFPDTEEAVVRARADRLVAQTDSFFLARIGEGAAAPAPATEAE